MLLHSDFLRTWNSRRGLRFWQCWIAAMIVACGSPLWSVESGPPRPTNGTASTDGGPAAKSDKEAGIDLRPCSFQNVTPGETPIDVALQQLGVPAEDRMVDGQRVLEYDTAPFEKVEVIAEGDLITSVVLHFKTPALPTQIEHELNLQAIVSVPVFSDSGQLLGRSYPERGVLLSFDPASKSRRATHVVLEPVTAQSFLLRVRADSGHHYEQNLADLAIARRFDPADPDVLLLSAELQVKSGQLPLALETIEQALQAQPGDAGLMMRQAELLARLDRLDEAQELARGLVKDGLENPAVRGRGEKLLGDLLTMGRQRDFSRAIEHHLAAIKLLAPAASDKRPAVRRAAKELLIESFLAAAYDIAAGDWQDKEATTTKWLASARELSESLITQDGGDEMWRLRLTLGTLAAQAELASGTMPESLISSVVRDIQRLNDASGDPQFQRELELLRVKALFDAASIAHRRDRTAQARELANQAVSAFESLAQTRELDASERYMIGRLYFFVGSDLAVSEKNHQAAIGSYIKARRYLGAKPPQFAAQELGRHGERWVSMGASYFEIGEQEFGVKLTRDGLDRMKEAVQAGLLERDRLALPYNNLAAMVKLQGRSQEASELAEMATRASSGGKSAKRR